MTTCTCPHLHSETARADGNGELLVDERAESARLRARVEELTQRCCMVAGVLTAWVECGGRGRHQSNYRVMLDILTGAADDGRVDIW